MELIATEIHQNKCRWIFLGIYEPPPQNVIEFTNKLSLIIDHFLHKYETLILIGDFNFSTENHHLDVVIQTYNFNNLINKPTCFLSNNPT